MLYDLINLPVPSRRSNIVESKLPDVLDQREQLFDTIFSINPHTGLPSSDISAFLTDKVSPEIKDFIQKELLKPAQKVGASSDLSDDDLVRFSRQNGESVAAYKSRLLDFIESQDEN